ncbi:MAG: YidH family protein [Cyanobacteriota bacterium]|jgi:putative membrane protein
MNLTNELAKERNRAAAERTLMAWIRTSLSLISFGFGVDKVVGAINRSRWGTSARADLSVRLMAIAFIVTGIGALAAATLQHKRILRRLTRDDFTYQQGTSLGIGTALALMAIGFLCLVILINGMVR